MNWLRMALIISFVGFGTVVSVPYEAESDDKSKSKRDTEEELPSMRDNAPLELEMWGGIRDLYKIAVPKPLGTGAVSSRGMEEPQMHKIVELMDLVLINQKKPEILRKVKEEVARLCREFPVGE